MHIFSASTKAQFRRLIALFVFFLVYTVPILAHPHLFITAQLEFVWNQKKLQGVYQTWTFDRFFSADIIQGYDLNHDGIFDKNETEDVYANAFINTKNYYYFTFIRQKEVRSSPQKVSKFSVRQKDGLVSYRFYVDVSQYNREDFHFAVYDYTFFCDFRYAAKDPVTFTYDKRVVQPQYEITENKNYPVFYDPLDTADMSTIYTEWRPGLQVYYPKEIHIWY